MPLRALPAVWPGEGRRARSACPGMASRLWERAGACRGGPPGCTARSEPGPLLPPTPSSQGRPSSPARPRPGTPGPPHVFQYLSRSLGLDSVAFGYLQTTFGVLQLLGGPVFGR